MLTAKDIKEGLINTIRKAGIDFPVHFNHVNNSSKSYIWIELRPQKRNLDGVYFQRILFVDIHTVLVPDNNTEVKHTDLWDIVDKLDEAIMPCIAIKDRFVTIQETNSYIFDDILHYEFTLNFTDFVSNAEYEGLAYELMQKLEVKLNEGTPLSVYFNEEGEK